jgi:glucose-1-phosphate cytidylyltransferase
MATYADGLSDVPLNQLVAYQSKSGALGTITCVPLRSQYGTVTTDSSGRVTEFYEKPVLSEYWINAGFFVMNSGIFDHWHGENLEREVFPNLLPGRRLASFRHFGFFKSLDTYKDQQEIEAMIEAGELLWIRREPAAA